jgi:ATP-binding cassette subfamily B multidrug efflux pump
MSSSSADLINRPFRFYFKSHPRAFALGVISLFFTNFFDVLTPLGLKMGIDAVNAKNADGLYKAIFIYLGVMFGVTLFRYQWRIHFGRFHHSVADDLRCRIFKKLTELGPSFFQKNPIGELMSLLTNDVNTFRMAIGPGVLILLDGVFLLGLILPVMAYMSWDWTWKCLILLPLVPFVMRHLEKLVHERYRDQQDRLAEVSANAQEIVSGIRVIKSFAQEDTQGRNFDRQSKAYEDACNRFAKVDALFQPSMESAIAMGSVALLWFGTPDVMRAHVSLGTLVAFHEYIKRLMWPMSGIGMAISMVEQGRASFGRVRELLSTETDIPDNGTRSIETFEKLEVRGLTFRYPGAERAALSDVNLTIHAGETIGVVGPVGAGKTSLLQVLCRLFPVDRETILINGVEISDIRRSSLTGIFSYVTQDAFLFSDTVAENIALGLNQFPGFEPVEEVTRTVNIDAEIREIPEGYSAYVGERGVNLSGGQKQRLAIARALIRRSQVILLDDSLSAVDGKTEKAITAELRAKRDATVVIVSHRLATLRHADRILVLNNGHVEAMAPHNELLSLSPTYRKLFELQSAPTVVQAERELESELK